MKRILVKVIDKSTILKLKKYGDIDVISEVFKIYALVSQNDKALTEISQIPGVISVEEEEYYEPQEVSL